MKNHEESRFIDALLDAGLAQYRGVEPRPGLENRILAQLRAEPEAPPWLAWGWGVGAALAAVGVVLVSVSIAYRQRPRAPVAVAESPQSAAALARSSAPHHQAPSRAERVAHVQTRSADLVSKSAAFSLAPLKRRRVSQKRNSALLPAVLPREPRQGVFPSPAPLSEEEQLLVSYVRQSPDAASAAFHENGQPVASLRIPDLNIPPLETTELSSVTTDQTR